MLIKDSDRDVKTREAMRGGPGSVLIKDVCTKDDLYGKGRLFAQMVLRKNCGIGYHEHTGEKEIFLINSGKLIAVTCFFRGTYNRKPPAVAPEIFNAK